MGELIAEIAARTALDGVTSRLQIVRHVQAASTPLRLLQCALAVGMAVGMAVANGALTVATAAMMVRVGATSPAPIVQRAQEHSTAVLLHQGAGECAPSHECSERLDDASSIQVSCHVLLFSRSLPSCGVGA